MKIIKSLKVIKKLPTNYEIEKDFNSLSALLKTQQQEKQGIKQPLTDYLELVKK